MIYTHPAELDYNELKTGDIVVIGPYQGEVTHSYINFGRFTHRRACSDMEIRSLARKIYSDQSDMSGDFPQYTNMRDATKIVKELMRRYGIQPNVRRADNFDREYVCAYHDVPMFATEAGPIYDDVRVRAMRDGTSVSYSDGEKICPPEPMMARPEKKRLISFPKIR